MIQSSFIYLKKGVSTNEENIYKKNTHHTMKKNETIQNNNNNYIHHLNLFSVKHTIKEKQNKNIKICL